MSFPNTDAAQLRRSMESGNFTDLPDYDRYVIDPEVLAISNRWRKERGEPELTMR